jgi:hypothetical protein
MIIADLAYRFWDNPGVALRHVREEGRQIGWLLETGE